ncbi:MAG: type II secretion system ATPase GspE [Chlamydiae bacterium]|nr:type II secretion system ATPase GspE [Chlamydiota bacterium]
MIEKDELFAEEGLEQIAAQFGISIREDLLSCLFVKEKIHLIPYSFAKYRFVLPLEERDGKIVVALANPLDLYSCEELRSLLQKDIIEVLASKEALEDAIERCYHQKENEASEVIASFHTENDLVQDKGDGEGYDLLEQTMSSPVIKMLNVMLQEAIQQGASDIHFEPLESGLSVRYRIDGVLQRRHAPSKEFQAQILTRIKVMARLDIAEHRLPQDGRIKLHIGGRQIDFRVSTVPVVFGERIVMRILDKSNVMLGLNKLGMRNEVFTQFKKQIQHKEGIVLVTGPTGSGKTTTLYSALAEINTSEMNIMTIEDPVEYKIQGIAQMGVNPKIDLHFSTGLRHILRQDPDIIMIGEIRDKETAEIAIQASLTGHLVLSTLHTNDAPSALTRLVDMGIEPYLLASSVIGVLAQRLVRTICPFCKDGYTPSQGELEELEIYGENPEDLTFYHGKGCTNCYETGYKGRHGIYELMPVGAAIKNQIMRSGDSGELQRVAKDKGMLSLRQEGAFLVKLGLTTSAEVLRVSRGCE